MNKKSRINFILRTILFFSALIVFIYNPNNLYNILNCNLIFGIKIYHICWLYLINDVLKVIIPCKNKTTYNGKLFLKHYKEKNNYDKNAVSIQTVINNKNAFNVLLAWICLNSILFYIYFKLDLNKSWVIMLFLFYYWCDMICVNIWCPFQVFFMKNKCCNVCRIYNWDHIMYFTPFILIPNIYTYSLIVLSIISLFLWEYQLKKHPERFLDISILNLGCANCKNECRFNKRKIKHIKRKNIMRYKYEK